MHRTEMKIEHYNLGAVIVFQNEIENYCTATVIFVHGKHIVYNFYLRFIN